jgi:hypothetical protein
MATAEVNVAAAVAAAVEGAVEGVISTDDQNVSFELITFPKRNRSSMKLR